MWTARDRWLNITKHANEGMWQERPPVSIYEIQLTLEEPDHDDGHEAQKKLGRRTIRLYYRQDHEEITVHGVSATRTGP